MLSAMARHPEVVSLIRKKQYFVMHAQRQCGKTTLSHEDFAREGKTEHRFRC